MERFHAIVTDCTGEEYAKSFSYYSRPKHAVWA